MALASGNQSPLVEVHCAPRFAKVRRAVSRPHHSSSSMSRADKYGAQSDYGPPKTSQKRRQQKLTELQFVPHPNHSVRGDGLQLVRSERRRRSGTKNRTSLLKRDSTLTQMDFLGVPALPPPNVMDVGSLNDVGGIPSFDGPSDARQLRSTEARDTVSKKSTSKRKRTRQDLNSDEVCRKTRKKQKPSVGRDDENPLTVDEAFPRRNTDPQNSKMVSLKYRSGIEAGRAIHKCAPNTPKGSGRSVTGQEAVIGWEDEENQKYPSTWSLVNAGLRTPARRHDFIPSSQSPESLLPSTKRSRRSVVQDRSPLQARSTNLPLASLPSNDRSFQRLQLDTMLPPKSKSFGGSEPRSNSHYDAYGSHQEGASRREFIRQSASTCPLPRPRSSFPVLEVQDSYSDDSEELEIPETSQVNGIKEGSADSVDHGTQATSADLDVLSSTTALVRNVTSSSNERQTHPNYPDVMVKDFALENVHMPVLEPVMPNERTAASLVVDDGDEDEGLDTVSLGSSIANDTQFNAEVAHRMSTPSLGKPGSPSKVTPQLPTDSSNSLASMGADITSSPPMPPLLQHAGRYYTGEAVLLNDRSSPTLPRERTQQSIRPAPMTRASQVSTQGPTQPYLPQSSLPFTRSSPPPHPEHPIYTIKESSSVRIPMQDIPSARHSPDGISGHLVWKCGHDDQYGDLDPASDLALDGIFDVERAKRGGSHEEEAAGEAAHESQIDRTRTALKAISPEAARRGKTVKVPGVLGTFVIPDAKDLLSESMLESVPGPPGWSQSSWDDEPI